MNKVIGWDACVARYERLRYHPHWSELSMAMLDLIARLRQDKQFADVVQTVSHAWLRLGPPSDHPLYKPTVWVGWRKPNYYWIGIGAFGTEKRITVSGANVLPMLHRYLSRLPAIDPTHPLYSETFTEPDPWAKAALEERYAQLEADEVLLVMAEEAHEQLGELRDYAETLHQAMSELERIDGSREQIEAILARVSRVIDLLEVGSRRARHRYDHRLERLNGH